MQLVKPKARRDRSGVWLVQHPSPADGRASFDTCLDSALALYYRCTINDMIEPQPAGAVVHG